MIVVFSFKNLFSNRFDSKYLGNTLKALLNQSIASKKKKKKPQNIKSTRKNLHELMYMFVGVFKGK